MFRKICFALMCSLIALNFACGSAETTDANVNKAVNIAVDQSNLPPEFSSKPIETNGASTPGIPDANSANLSKGATPTPGIPDPATIGKTPMPKNTPPIPGIPSEEELKKQMNTPRNADDVNKVPPAGAIENPGKRPADKKQTVSNSN